MVFWESVSRSFVADSSLESTSVRSVASFRDAFRPRALPRAIAHSSLVVLIESLESQQHRRRRCRRR